MIGDDKPCSSADTGF